MHETFEKWLNIVNSCVSYARQICKIYQALSHSVFFKTTVSFEIHWVRQNLVIVFSFGIKYL